MKRRAEVAFSLYHLCLKEFEKWPTIPEGLFLIVYQEIKVPLTLLKKLL